MAGFSDLFGGGYGGGLGGAMPWNTMAGLGLGLMGGTVGNPYGAAMQGFQHGANADAQIAYRNAMLKQQAEERATANAFRERQFTEQKRQFEEARKPKPTIHWDTQEDIYGNKTTTPYLVNPEDGSYRPLSRQNAEQLSQQLGIGSDVAARPNVAQAVVPGVNSSVPPNDEGALPPNAAPVQGGGAPLPPAGTNQKEWVKGYSHTSGQETAKAAAKRDADRAAKESSPAYDIVMTDADRAIKAANMLTTGFGGQLSKDIGGTPAHDLSQLLNGIKANISFDKLQSMRASSPTGGALGNVSDKDMALLQSTLGSVEQSQSKDQFVTNLKRLKKVYYETIHGPGSYSAGAGGDYPRVKSPTEALRLPRGTKFLDPDGNLRTVP